MYMMKKMNLILKKCKTLSRQLSRTSSSSYDSLRSQSARHHHRQRQTWVWGSAAEMMLQVQDVVVPDYPSHPRTDHLTEEDDHCETLIFVGSSRRRFSIKSKYLDHPLLKAIIQKSREEEEQEKSPAGEGCALSIKCEVVLFDHLLWMLENADPNLAHNSGNLSLEELADLYL